jgi:hypothetical protein
MERRFKAGGPRPGTEERFRVLAACEQNNAAGQRMPNGSTYEQFRVLYLTLTSAQRQAYRDDFVQQMSSPPRSYPAALSKCMAVSLRLLSAPLHISSSSKSPHGPLLLTASLFTVTPVLRVSGACYDSF